jgi:hypothetical protein
MPVFRTRSVFYLWRKAYETKGEQGLVDKKPCPVNIKRRTPPETAEHCPGWASTTRGLR